MDNNKIKKHIKPIIILVFVIVIMGFSNSVFAEINEGYATETISGGWLKNVEISSSLLNPIGTLLLWVGGFIQTCLSMAALAISGEDQTIMPWADAIIYNAVPVLDVNFISPADGSIMSSLNIAIRTVYYSVLALSLVFFSLSVMLMAVKLAISTIAEEKAKYKEAIATWVKGILMIFLIHFFMSFVFFVNESLVTFASTMTTSILEKQGSKPIFTTNRYYEMLKEDAKQFGTASQQEIINNNPVFFSALMSEGSEVVNGCLGFETKGQNYNFKFIGDGKITSLVVTRAEAIERACTIYNFSFVTLSNEQIQNLSDPNKREAALNDLLKNYTDSSLYKNYINDSAMAKSVLEERRAAVANLIIKYNAFQKQLKAGKTINENDAASKSETSINYLRMVQRTPITKMADYFRKNAYTPRENSYVKTDINLPFAIMYLMFAVQSALYFLAYTKRLFYVVIFAIMAPAIIVWDFVHKI